MLVVAWSLMIASIFLAQQITLAVLWKPDLWCSAGRGVIANVCCFQNWGRKSMLEFRECLYCSGKSWPSHPFCRKAPGDFKRGMIFILPLCWLLVFALTHRGFMEVCLCIWFWAMECIFNYSRDSWFQVISASQLFSPSVTTHNGVMDSQVSGQAEIILGFFMLPASCYFFKKKFSVFKRENLFSLFLSEVMGQGLLYSYTPEYLLR